MKDISLEELSFAADQVFVYWEDLAAIIIDFPKIVKEWSNKSYLGSAEKLRDTILFYFYDRPKI